MKRKIKNNVNVFFLFLIAIILINCDGKNINFSGKHKARKTVSINQSDTEISDKIAEPTDKVVLEEYSIAAPSVDTKASPPIKSKEHELSGEVVVNSAPLPEPQAQQEYNTEGYDKLVENDYLSAKENPLSTFSIDVDGASYSNARRYITAGNLPPKDAIRIEEFINYFDYNYVQPKGEHPFSINMEVANCPWNTAHKLVHVGLQGKRIPFAELAPLNLVFLLDVSGSMEDNNKLPLLKKSFRLLVNKLRPQDKIAIVVYAGAAGLVLPATSGSEKATIFSAIENLSAGGSTAGGEGIELAYAVAEQNKISNGQNRVILATDGDFNVGVSSDGDMTRLIEGKRKQGIYLTAIGVGMGNYKDSKMESMADNGNGNYFYIDNIEEAQKVLVTELDGTIYTIAKDVKLQIEFNPAKVKGYRLIGYENRLLKKEDFNNDKKDAGELGAGHAVTALYEIIPADSKEELPGKVDALKYQGTAGQGQKINGKEMMTVKFRYKNPADSTSKLIVQTLEDKDMLFEKSSENFRFAAAVASFGMILRDSEYKGKTNFETVFKIADAAKGNDMEGYRAEFLRLVKTSALLAEQVQSKK